MAKKLYEEASVQAIADAIRAKNGSADTYKISEMSAAISAIPTGGGGLSFDAVSSFTYSPASTHYSDGNFVGVFPNATALYFPGANLTNIDVTVTTKLKSFSLHQNKSVVKVTFRGDASGVTSFYRSFSAQGAALGANAICAVIGLDFTSVTNATQAFFQAHKLSVIDIKPDTVNVALDFAYSPLNVASCINLLNALKDRTDKTALTLTLKSTLTTAETGTLYVNYVKLDADTGLYASCEQTDDSATTIAAAITAKNWTIA